MALKQRRLVQVGARRGTAGGCKRGPEAASALSGCKNSGSRPCQQGHWLLIGWSAGGRAKQRRAAPHASVAMGMFPVETGAHQGLGQALGAPPSISPTCHPDGAGTAGSGSAPTGPVCINWEAPQVRKHSWLEQWSLAQGECTWQAPQAANRFLGRRTA